MKPRRQFKNLGLLVALAALPLVYVAACTSSNFGGASGNRAAGGGEPASAGNGGTGGTNGTTDSNNNAPNGGAGSSTDGLDTGSINPNYGGDQNGPLITGNAGTSAGPHGTTDGNGYTPIRIYTDGFGGIFALRPLTPNQNNFIWAATVDGAVTFLKLKNGAVTTVKKWSGALSNPGDVPGSRTYVLEGGSAIVSRIGGHLYFIDPDNTPQGDIKSAGGASYYKLNGPIANTDRVCVVSYRRNGNRYLGMAWGKGSFTEVPQANTPPYQPLWAQANVNAASGGTAQWGYSCFIDQNRMIFYSQWTKMSGGPIQAIDLNTMQAVTPAAVAPNGTFVSAVLAKENVGPKAQVGAGSYAMAGDGAGNILNGTGYYTFSYEPQSNTIWGNGYDAGSPLIVAPASCFSTDANCTGYSTFNPATVGFHVGPMSALGDGHVVGMVRGSGGVVLMSLNDPKDTTKGVTATKIYDLGSDPYMYTDFTGATLYLTTTTQSFTLGTVSGYDATKPFKALGFAWAPRDAAKTAWQDIQLDIRCYSAAAGNPPDFTQVAAVKDALQQTWLTAVPSCTGQIFDTVDVRLTQLNNNNTLMNVRKTQITGYQ